MTGFDINKAARLMRAGDEFSKINEKLKESAISFVKWLFDKVGEWQLPGKQECEWIIAREQKETGVYLSYNTDTSGWNSISTIPGKTSINQILIFCQTLSGPRGDKLLAWIENEIKERQKMLADLQSTIAVLFKI